MKTNCFGLLMSLLGLVLVAPACKVSSDGIKDAINSPEAKTYDAPNTVTDVNTDHTYECIIVGGGLAGMVSAYKLKGNDIKVLEKWPGVGGRIWEGEYRGFTYGRGAEYIGTPLGTLAQIVKDYNLTPVEVEYPSHCHYNPNVPNYENITIYNGYEGVAFMHVMEDGGDKTALKNYNRFQSETSDFYDQLIEAGWNPPFFDLTHSAASFDDITMRQWFEDRGFGPSYQNRWNSHARGLYGANMDEVSMLMAISETGWEYYQEEPIGMPDKSWNEYVTGLYNEETFTFLHGMSEIPRSIANDLGDKVVVNATVFDVSRNGDLYTVKYRDKEQNTVTLQSSSVILAVPAPVAVEIAPTLLTGEKRELMEDMDYSEMITVNIFSEEPIQDFTFDLSLPGDHFVTDFYDSLWVQKWQNPQNPLNDEVFIITAFIAGHSYTDDLTGLSDKEVMDGVYADMNEIFPGASSKVTKYEINRFQYGYPVFGLGAFHNITRLNELNNQDPTFMLTGDYMALPTTEAAAEHGAYVADRVAIGSGDEDGNNLIQNGGFEDGADGWTNLTTSPWSLTSELSHEGSHSAKYVGDSTLHLFQWVTLQPNTDYEISACMRTEPGSSGKLVFDTTGTFDGAGEGQFVHATHDGTWHCYSGSFNSGVFTKVKIRCFAMAAGFSGTGYFDDLAITPAAIGA